MEAMNRAFAPFKKPSLGIICACDLDRLEDVSRVVEAIDPVEGLVGYKLGSLLSLRYGLAEAVKAVRRMTAKVLLYDHQKAGLDVPSMGAGYVAVCRDAGVDALSGRASCADPEPGDAARRLAGEALAFTG